MSESMLIKLMSRKKDKDSSSNDDKKRKFVEAMKKRKKQREARKGESIAKKINFGGQYR